MSRSHNNDTICSLAAGLAQGLSIWPTDTAAMEDGGAGEVLGVVWAEGRGAVDRRAEAKECVMAPTLAEAMICCHFCHFFIHRGEQRA